MNPLTALLYFLAGATLTTCAFTLGFIWGHRWKAGEIERDVHAHPPVSFDPMRRKHDGKPYGSPIPPQQQNFSNYADYALAYNKYLEQIGVHNSKVRAQMKRSDDPLEQFRVGKSQQPFPRKGA